LFSKAYHLIDELTVYENTETYTSLLPGCKSSEKERYLLICDRFQMVGKKISSQHSYQGGQQQ